MRITWKDGVTTIAAGAAILLERAYFHQWDLPLVSSMNWVITGLVALIAVGVIFSYALDEVRGKAWSIVTGVLGVAALALAGLGIYTGNSDYVVLLMLNAVVFWMASIVRHVTVQSPVTHSHV